MVRTVPNAPVMKLTPTAGCDADEPVEEPVTQEPVEEPVEEPVTQKTVEEPATQDALPDPEDGDITCDPSGQFCFEVEIDPGGPVWD